MQRYISNDIPLQTLAAADPSELLLSTLEQLVHDVPPPSAATEGHSSSHRRSGGLFTGYTGLAYLFLHISASRRDLRIAGYKAIEWAIRYLGEHDPHVKIEQGSCGIGSERLAYHAVKACITRDPHEVKRFLADVDLIIRADETDDPFPSELANGRAGTLYMLRMVKHWVPGHDDAIDKAMKAIAKRILATDDDGQGNWQWHGKRYFGAAHGDIGIITQVVLSVPSLARQVSPKLEELLDSQLEDGNFASSCRSLERGKSDLVQTCHGAAGFVYSLQAIRSYLPDLQRRIDQVVSRAQKVIWEKGLLTKEPCLCHGIFGSAL